LGHNRGNDRARVSDVAIDSFGNNGASGVSNNDAVPIANGTISHASSDPVPLARSQCPNQFCSTAH